MPEALSLVSPEPADPAALRARIAAIERGGAAPACAAAGSGAAVVRLGVAAVDEALPGGGLARGAVHEIAGAADSAAAGGFAAALAGRAAGASGPAVWCTRDGSLYAPGLAAFGLDTARLVAVRAPCPRDALWALEEALRAGVPAVVGEADAGLTASRRLQLAARAGGGLCLLLPPPDRCAGALAAATRWRIAPAAAAPRPGGGPGAARWRLSLTRCRGGTARDWTVEWCHETHRFSLAAPLADRAGPAGRAGPPERVERAG